MDDVKRAVLVGLSISVRWYIPFTGYLDKALVAEFPMQSSMCSCLCGSATYTVPKS